MSKEQLKAVLALALGLSIWGGASAQSASTIEGTWTGTAYQNEGTSDTVIITITPTGAESRYPELNCAAKLIRVGAAGDYVFFTEAIIRDGPGGGGNCINGTVTVAPALDKLAWEWFGSFQGRLTSLGACLRQDSAQDVGPKVAAGSIAPAPPVAL